MYEYWSITPEFLSRSDAETGGGQGMLRHRKSVQRVGPSPSDTALNRQLEEDTEEREHHGRAYRGHLNNTLSYLLLPYVLIHVPSCPFSKILPSDCLHPPAIL